MQTSSESQNVSWSLEHKVRMKNMKTKGSALLDDTSIGSRRTSVDQKCTRFFSSGAPPGAQQSSDRTARDLRVSRHISIETYCARAALERRLERRLEFRLVWSHFPAFFGAGGAGAAGAAGEAAGEAPAAEVALTLVSRPLRLSECS